MLLLSLQFATTSIDPIDFNCVFFSVILFWFFFHSLHCYYWLFHWTSRFGLAIFSFTFNFRQCYGRLFLLHQPRNAVKKTTALKHNWARRVVEIRGENERNQTNCMNWIEHLKIWKKKTDIISFESDRDNWTVIYDIVWHEHWNWRAYKLYVRVNNSIFHLHLFIAFVSLMAHWLSEKCWYSSSFV